MPTRKNTPAKTVKRTPRKDDTRVIQAGDVLAKICEAYNTVAAPLMDEIITCLKGPVVHGQPVPADAGCPVLAAELQTLKDALDEAFGKICPPPTQ
jgi:hypothetical protein